MRAVWRWGRAILRWAGRLGCLSGIALLFVVVMLLLLGERPLAGRTAAGVVVEAPPEVVFEHLVSAPLVVEWQALHGLEVDPGPAFEPDSRLTLQILRDDQQVLTLEGEVVKVEPPRRLSMILRFGNPWGTGWTQLVQYRLVGDRVRTQLVATGDAQYRGAALRLLEPVITANAQKRLRESLGRLKALVESGGTPAEADADPSPPAPES